MASRHDLFACEFDFLAVDVDDHIALFSSAGYGPLPVVVLDDPERESDAVAATESLPVVSSIARRLRARGDDSSWHSRVRRGLFAYDWSDTYGPYRSVAVPATPVRLDAIRPIATRLGALPRLSICFADCEVVDLRSSGLPVDDTPDPRTLPT